MTTPADELRTAAAKLRKLTDQATEAPWRTAWSAQQYELVGLSSVDPIAEWTYAIATWEPKASEQRAECDTADADYIAAMHPGVGKALARLLDLEETYLVGMPENESLAHVRAALAVARALNGGEQQ